MKKQKNSKQINKHHDEYTGVGRGTGVYCSAVEFEALLEIINEVRKTSMIQVKGGPTSGTIRPMMLRTQQDVFLLVAKLAEKHKLPSGFYAVNSSKEFIRIHAREDDYHTIYEL